MQHSRVRAALAVLLTALAPPARAQLAGRWLVRIDDSARGTVRGELRLSVAASRANGTLWLEGQPGGPSPIRGGHAGPADSIAFTADAGGTDRTDRFIGRLEGEELHGRANSAAGAARAWSATRLPPDVEYYPVLPRFTVSAIVTGRRDSLIRLPGPWLAAAAATGESVATLDSAYRRSAAAAGLPLLTGDRLMTGAPLRAMGVLQRDTLVAAAVRTLVSIRSGLADPDVRGRFDRLFRPRGAWQVDLHDVALARARAASPALRVDMAVPALRAAGLLPREAAVDAGTVVHGLYRLYALKVGDSVAFASVSERMRSAEPMAAAAALLLMGGYESATAWYGEAIRFFLDEPWIPDPAPHSIGDLVRAAWHDSAVTPAIEARVFGYPQAVPRYGVADPLFDRLVHDDNWAAGEWLRRHGRGGLLAVLHRVTLNYGPGATLVLPGETLRLATPRGLTGEDANGFLEPHDAIAIDPAYVPLLALGTVVHEWQHLLLQKRLASSAATSAEPVVMSGLDPFIAEGLAEWRAERILAPLVTRFPLLLVGEIEKRDRLAHARPDDQHVLGYWMVRALARVTGDDDYTVSLLVAAAPSRAGAATVLGDAAVAAAWRRFAALPDRSIAAPSRRALVPELSFTIEDEFPDLLGVRIVAP